MLRRVEPYHIFDPGPPTRPCESNNFQHVDLFTIRRFSERGLAVLESMDELNPNNRERIHRLYVPTSLAAAWAAHRKRWEGCNDCPLAETRQNSVLARGHLRCDVLFIGEGPGEGEDLLRLPFMGPAGRVLDVIIFGAQDETFDFRYCITNTVACRATDGRYGANRTPKAQEVAACSPRLAEMLHICQPLLVVRVGKVAGGIKISGHAVDMLHPSAMLLGDNTPREMQRAKLSLISAVRRIWDV